ncbi:hypothetical protein F511_38711 [Dorcoceras hygrometricum]|uniref:CCHC-type domain-containing protein n=1 Tax=Dorcoceras hygrometricum TaxID=472368 RepID=A0A2Z7B444_9LAMI|nr:hypothetical protein F511_38711 [Dorcoceras hygrometricum]
MKPNLEFAISGGEPQFIEKSRHEYTNEDKKKVNLDNVARDILYKTLDKNMFSKINTCATAKEIWEKLTQICEGNDETKENKLTVAQQKYESIKMKDGEKMTEFDERFSAVVIELTSLGKEYSNRELALKVMRALPREWDVKTMAMRESKDLNKLELHDLFANLKAYEFELETRAEAAPSTSQPTKALAATTAEQCSPSTSNTADQLSDDVMSLFVKKFGKYLRRSYNPSAPYNNVHKNDKTVSDINCFNCGRPGHFAADCNRTKKEDRYRRDDKKEDRYKRDDKTDERTVDRSKDRSKDRRMRTRGDKRPSRKNDRKVLMAEESTKSWADNDSDSSSSSSSSSESEQEEVHCLMANQTSDDEVFDFSNIEFTREDLVSALNDMVKEYMKLSQTMIQILHPAVPHQVKVNRRRFTVSWLIKHLMTRYSTSLTLNLHEKTLSVHLMIWSKST